MSRIVYKVWSAYPPALTRHPLGGQQIVAGTIEKVMVGSTLIPITQRLPDTTSVSQLVWMRPAPPKVVPPTITKVAGSKGAVYTVKKYLGGRVTCDCPGFSYRKTCKHIGA